MKIDREELRRLVREALREALGGTAPTAARAAPPPPRSQAAAPAATARPEAGFAATLRAALAARRPARVAVSVRSSAELDGFARDVAADSSQPDLRAAIASGDLGFDLAGGPAATQVPSAAAKVASTGTPYEMKSGVLSETRIVEIARTHKRIAVGADVVLTPLARDKARELKVELTRQKP
jgi:hypothetical protein